jgi:hypothetical protein
MTVPLARRNLFSEKARFAISVAGVGFAVLLILIVLALYRGFSRSGQTFKDLPGDLWVVQQGTTDPFHCKDAPVLAFSPVSVMLNSLRLRGFRP